MRRRATALVLALMVGGCLAGCGDDGESSATAAGSSNQAVTELTATGVAKYLGLEPDSSSRNGDWEEYRYDKAKEKAICLRGGTYQVNVRRGSSNKVLLYLEGGGACWDYNSCYVAGIAKATAGSASGGGILDNSRQANPFKDWNVVYASYCDGSVFAGDNIVNYRDKRTFHHGLYNLSAAVTLMLRNFPNPERIVVSGSSAGGFGTYTGYGVVRVAYPHSDILVFDDSGPGLQNKAATQTIEERATNWKYNEVVPASCTDCSDQLTYLTNWAVERDPGLRVAYFNYQEDFVLRYFLAVGDSEFRELLLSVTGAVQRRNPDRIKRFLPRGETHTTLADNGFYDKALEGVTVRDWTVAFLANDQSIWRDIVEP